MREATEGDRTGIVLSHFRAAPVTYLSGHSFERSGAFLPKGDVKYRPT